jgi:hypothetical protein
MNRTLYLIPPIVNQTQANEEESTSFDIFQEKGSPLEQFYYGKTVSIAPTLNLTQATQSPETNWACAQLVHIHATRDHLVLTDPSILNIQVDEEAALRSSIQDLLNELAPKGLFPSNSYWIFEAERFKSLQTHSPALAIGRNIDIWMPKDTLIKGVAKQWRQIQNEIQMIWHDHPVNESRVNRGELPINSIWLFGIGPLSAVTPHPLIENLKHFSSQQSVRHGLMDYLKKDYFPLSEILTSKKSLSDQLLIDAHDLSASAWDTQWQMLWRDCLDKLYSETIDRIVLLVPTGDSIKFLELTKKDIQANIIQRLLFRKRLESIRHPDYSLLANSSKWKAYQPS